MSADPNTPLVQVSIHAPNFQANWRLKPERLKRFLGFVNQCILESQDDLKLPAVAARPVEKE